MKFALAIVLGILGSASVGFGAAAVFHCVEDSAIDIRALLIGVALLGLGFWFYERTSRLLGL